MEQINVAGHALLENLTHPNELFPMSEFIDYFDTFSGGGFPSHWHPEFELQYIVKGCAEYLINGRTYKVGAGNALYIAPEVIHMARQTQHGTIGYNIVLSPHLIIDVMKAINCSKYALPLTSNYQDALLVTGTTKQGSRILQIMTHLYNSENAYDAGELFLLENLISLWRHLITLLPARDAQRNDAVKTLREYRMKLMLAYIHRNYAETITVSELAASASVSSSECYRCFAELSETTPVEYINHYRLLQASQMLLETSDSISDICFACGFSSTSYFTKLFRKQYGITPRDYRAGQGEIRSVNSANPERANSTKPFIGFFR